MPFEGFENFDACVLAMTAEGHSDEEARKLCGKMQAEAEGKGKDEGAMMNDEHPEPAPGIVLDALPAAGVDGTIEIPVAVEGEWHRGKTKFAITAADLDAMVANFEKRKDKEINIDYDHASEMPEVAAGGPIPSAGRILALRVGSWQSAVGQALALMAKVSFTQRAAELIKREEYRRTSPAIVWGLPDKHTGKPQGATLTSLALTNRPFLEELPAIKLSEVAGLGIGDSGFASPETRNPNTETRREKENTMDPITIKAAEGGKIEVFRGSESLGTAEVPASAFEATLEQERAKARALLLTEIGMSGKASKDVRERLTAADRLEKEHSGREADRVFFSEAVNEDGIVSRKKLIAAVEGKAIQLADFLRFEEAEKKVDEAFKAGKITPAHRRFFLGAAIRDAEGFEGFLASAPAVVHLSDRGIAGGEFADGSKRFLALVNERVKEGKMPYAQALTEVGRQHPQLWDEYSKATTRAN